MVQIAKSGKSLEKVSGIFLCQRPFIGNSFRDLLILVNPYWQISGTFLRPFYWKIHPSKNHEYLFSFFKNRVVS